MQELLGGAQQELLGGNQILRGACNAPVQRVESGMGPAFRWKTTELSIQEEHVS